MKIKSNNETKKGILNFRSRLGAACLTALFLVMFGFNFGIAEVNAQTNAKNGDIPRMMTISPLKMNVLYRGIPNPISVGGTIDGITVTAPGATVTQADYGIYQIIPGSDNEVVVHVSYKGASLGSVKFRVKDLPKPMALIRNVVNGQVTKSSLLVAGRVEAEMKDFDFDGVHYDVVGYTMIYKTKAGTIKEIKANGGAFTDEIKSVVSQANVGDMFVFTDIQVRGNDDKTKTLDSPLGIVIK